MTQQPETTTWTMTFHGPQVMIPTEFGTVRTVWPGAHQVCVTANSGNYGAEGDIVFRGRHYHGLLNLFADSGWSEDTGNPDYATSARPELRDITAPYGKGVMAPSYRATVVAAITRAVRDFAEAHPKITVAAEVSRLTRALERAQADEEKAAARIAVARDARRDIAAALTELKARAIPE